MTPDDTLLIAVDGGGSGCRVAVGTARAGMIAQAEGAAANIATDFGGAVENILDATKDALAKANLADTDLTQITAHVGLAGGDTAEARAQTRAALPFGNCTVTGDRETSVAGALGAQDGYVVALGTGTIIARQQDRRVRTVCGWGLALSDQASGAWLGRALLTRVLLAEDGIEPASDLSQQISNRLDGIAGIVRFGQTATPGKYAQFAPDIFAAGKAGDTLALELLNEGAAFVQKCLSGLGFVAGDVLSLAGGVGPHYARFLSAPFTQNLQTPKGSALEGAFDLAKQAAANQ